MISIEYFVFVYICPSLHGVVGLVLIYLLHPLIVMIDWQPLMEALYPALNTIFVSYVIACFRKLSE